VESLLDYVAFDQGTCVKGPPSFRIGPKVSHRAVSMTLSIHLPELGKYLMVLSRLLLFLFVDQAVLM
jgi:hypothetical protein